MARGCCPRGVAAADADLGPRSSSRSLASGRLRQPCRPGRTYPAVRPSSRRQTEAGYVRADVLTDRALGPRKTICVVAHDNKKDDLTEWVLFNRPLLGMHELVATGTTGTLIERRAGLGGPQFRG